jgi:hypothetical protein
MSMDLGMRKIINMFKKYCCVWRERWDFARPPQKLHGGSIVFMARDVLTMEWTGVSETLALSDIWTAVPHVHCVLFEIREDNIKKNCEDIGFKWPTILGF